eukprot:TRINITY_DN8721_c0_g1_i1.p1 TRINITY_DN8721_c0_g1~~TRINITY_DN8721_c0_g1_i1.p1  ORF type:complete len:228 (-),score=59.60 TRINITY_DN8721_c0_g1_i1:75-758(-)
MLASSSSMDMGGNTIEYLFKVIVIGEANVGKTSIIKRYVNNEFSNKYKYTIGVDFALKQVDWDENTVVRLQLWDIAGQERFGVMTHVYYKEATGVCIVYDSTSVKSFQAVERWKSDVESKVKLPNGDTVPCVLLANKCDLGINIDKQQLDDYVKDNNYIGWYATSAKSNVGIDQALHDLIEHIFSAIQIGGMPTKSKGLPLSKGPAQPQQEKSGCCFGGQQTKEIEQ